MADFVDVLPSGEEVGGGRVFEINRAHTEKELAPIVGKLREMRDHEKSGQIADMLEATIDGYGTENQGGAKLTIGVVREILTQDDATYEPIKHALLQSINVELSNSLGKFKDANDAFRTTIDHLKNPNDPNMFFSKRGFLAAVDTYANVARNTESFLFIRDVRDFLVEARDNSEKRLRSGTYEEVNIPSERLHIPAGPVDVDLLKLGSQGLEYASFAPEKLRDSAMIVSKYEMINTQLNAFFAEIESAGAILSDEESVGLLRGLKAKNEDYDIDRAIGGLGSYSAE